MPEEDYFLSEAPARDMFKVTLPPGELLNDRFKIERLLGDGRLSSVYLAHDTVRSERVALKVVGMARRSAIKPLIEEVKRHSSIANYSHIVHVYEIHLIQYGGAYLACLSMECADGGSLRDWLRQEKGNVSLRRSKGLEYFKQVCLGVRELHGAGIVHGDLKPENFLLTGGVIKVADLGLSRVVHNNTSDCELESQSPVGTPEYMSPEQVVAQRYQGVDVRADIYSLGVVLSEIVDSEGRPLFSGTTPPIYRGHLKTSPLILEGVGQREMRVIRRCLQKNPTDRYANVEELLGDLNNDPEAELATESDNQERLAQPREVGELHAQAHQAFIRNDLDGAAAACHGILKVMADHPGAKTMLDEIQGRYATAQQAYDLIERGIGYQSFDYLNSLLLEAIRTYPNHPRGRLVRVQLGTVARQFLQMMSEATQAMSQKQYDSALGSLERARQLAPGEPAATRLMNLAVETKQEVEITRGKIDAALEQGNRHKALALARALDRYTERIRHMMEQPGPQRSSYGTPESSVSG